SAVHLALRLCEITGEEAYREEAFQISEQSKSFALKRHLHHAFSAPQYGGEQRALWERDEALRQDINKLEAEYLRTQDTLFLSQAARKRVELWAFIQGLQDGNASGQRYYTERFDTDVPSIQEIQQSLGAEEALIEFDVSLSQNLAFVITRGGVQVVRLKGLKEHAALIDEFDDLLRNNGARFDSVSHRLYQKIFEPIKKALPDGIRHLIIVPDHKYWKINFDALAVQAQPREYLLEDHVISYSYSAAILHQLAKARESRRKKGHLGFFFGGYPEKDSLPSLDSLERKADSLSRALNMAKAYPEASSQHFAGALGDLDAAVLAVHGELGGRGDISGIHLVFPAAERRLFIQEAYGLPMEGFHFLVLAVCDGAWGNFSRGEGISSIARAFHYAGCPNLIAAQMKARDDPSADLMASFFKYLNEGFTYAEALKKAKVDTMKKANFRSPIYWAPFICIGDGFSRYR
ncbi:MAG: CHAT domain-containing protein, partial [Phaeodactylibacter sp.]|nr:CHAT domain-containing protein [Phaeodactylibacter sp.]